MHAHSPHLRVCVYEGWKLLQKGVQQERAAHNKVHAATQKRKNEDFRNQTISKYTRLNGSRRVKVETPSDSDYTGSSETPAIDAEVEKESTLDSTQRMFVDYVRAHDVVVTSY